MKTMTESKMTPVPYQYDRSDGRVKATQSTSGQFGEVVIADVWPIGYDTCDGAADANGDAIAALPDCLAALQSIVRDIESGKGPIVSQRNRDAARAALAKAGVTT